MQFRSVDRRILKLLSCERFGWEAQCIRNDSAVGLAQIKYNFWYLAAALTAFS